MLYGQTDAAGHVTRTTETNDADTKKLNNIFLSFPITPFFSCSPTIFGLPRAICMATEVTEGRAPPGPDGREEGGCSDVINAAVVEERCVGWSVR